MNTRDLHKIAWVKNRKREWSKQIKKISWSRVSSVKETGLKKTVYNLSVREDESYVADGLIVHNCMHHSTALGGRPINDQSRATAWHVLRWAEALRIDNILIENVPEFRTWGPIGANGRPVKSRKGETFEAFLNALVSLGYNVEWKVICAADYGDPTTRRRLFVMARKGNRKVAWPAQTHSEDGGDTIFGPTEKWVPAREIIDWQFPSQSIFGRKKPLAANTMRRIEAGIKKFWGPWAEPFLVMLYNMKDGKADGRYTRSVDGTLPTVTAQGGHIGVVQPFMVQVNHGKGEGGRLHSTGKPIPTVTGKNGMGLCMPFILSACGGGAPRSADQPVPTITGTSRGMGFCVPFVVQYHNSHAGRKDGDQRNHDVNAPLPTLDTQNRYAVCEPFMVPFFGERDGQEPRTHGVDKPLPAVTGHGAGGVVEPFIVGIAQTGGSGKRVRKISKPLPTLTSKQEQCLVQPFLVKYYGTGGPKSVGEPVDTITGKARYGLVEPKPGEMYGIDIRFRMLQPHELKKAMSMDDFVLTGTKSDQVKQIGNAVPVKTATALCRALIA